jgi:hypothetical protein
MDVPDRELKMLGTFWDFLAYLERYVELARDVTPVETDPARTLLLSTLSDCMRPVLRADVAFTGYRDLKNGAGDWLHIIKETSKIGREAHLRSPLIKRMEALSWRLPSNAMEAVQTGRPIMLFDRGLDKLPEALQGVVTALAASRVTLAEREYFLFFCDVEDNEEDFPRYNSFDKTMLAVATGILEVGFQSGIRRGNKAQRNSQGK